MYRAPVFSPTLHLCPVQSYFSRVSQSTSVLVQPATPSAATVVCQPEEHFSSANSAQLIADPVPRRMRNVLISLNFVSGRPGLLAAGTTDALVGGKPICKGRRLPCCWQIPKSGGRDGAHIQQGKDKHTGWWVGVDGESGGLWPGSAGTVLSTRSNRPGSMVWSMACGVGGRGVQPFSVVDSQFYRTVADVGTRSYAVVVVVVILVHFEYPAQ